MLACREGGCCSRKHLYILAFFCLVRTESCNCYTLPPPMPTTTSHSTFLILQLLSMGNEQSSSNSQSYKDILKHVDTDDPILATSGWAFYHAQPFPPHETHNGPLSLFISQGNFQDLKNLGKVLNIFQNGAKQ